MPAPRMPWDPQPPQPCLDETAITETVNEVIPEEPQEEEEEP